MTFSRCAKSFYDWSDYTDKSYIETRGMYDILRGRTARETLSQRAGQIVFKSVDHFLANNFKAVKLLRRK